MNRLERFDRFLARLESWAMIALLAVMTALSFAQASFRILYLHCHVQWANRALNAFDWAEPLTRLCVLWVTFLGAAALTHDGEHIRIDLLRGVPHRRVLQFKEPLLSAAAILVLGLLLAASWHYVLLERSFGARLLLGLPVWVAQVIIPVGFALILCHFGLRLTKQLYHAFHRS